MTESALPAASLARNIPTAPVTEDLVAFGMAILEVLDRVLEDPSRLAEARAAYERAVIEASLLNGRLDILQRQSLAAEGRALAGDGAATTDELVKLDSQDTTGGYLLDKLVLGYGLAYAVLNQGASERVSLAVGRHNHNRADGTGPMYDPDLACGVYNDTGSIISRGAVVHPTGGIYAQTTPKAELADATAIGKVDILGVAIQDIADTGYGAVQTAGYALLDTSAFTSGQTVYLSATTPGGLTATPPAWPNYRVRVGIVVVAAVAGVLFICPFVLGTGLGGATWYNDNLSAQANGVNLVYTLTATPNPAASLGFFVGGQKWEATGPSARIVSVVGNLVTVNFAVPNGVNVHATYMG